jgi:hypothetical protein
MSRYSQLYIDRGARTSDSDRARRRLAYSYSKDFPSCVPDFFERTQSELGYIHKTPTYKDAIVEFFRDANVVDFLDGITLCCEILNDEWGDRASRPWIARVARIFMEENLSYRIDARGVVHPFVDAEFELNRSAALEALNEPRFREARGEFEEAFRHLRNGEGKQAVRMMFPAVETAAKVLFPGKIARLMPKEIDRYLAPQLRQLYLTNAPALEAGNRLLEALKDWIIAS